MKQKSSNPPEVRNRNPLTLDEFPPHSYEDWRDAAEKLLKGSPFEKLLVTETYEEFRQDPIFRREDLTDIPHLDSDPGEGNYHRGSRASGYRALPWLVAQQTVWNDPTMFNTEIREEIARGVTEVNIPLEGPQALSLQTMADIDTAFDGLDWRHLSFNLQTTRNALPVAAAFVAYMRARELPLHAARGCIDNDPLAHLAETGNLPHTLEATYNAMAEITRFALTHCPTIKTIGSRGAPYANGGASSSQELGYTLATALEYIKEMRKRGLPINETASRIRMSLSIGPNFFMEIAKLRAARILWAQILKKLEAEDAAPRLHIHCRTGLANKTLYDPHVNLLRTTTEALAAILGNCDSLDIAPFDELNPIGRKLPRRIARNMHAILGEECDLKRVIDAGGGSYYLEWLTDQMARKAWEVFQEVEKTGGMSRALIQGLVQDSCSRKAEERINNFSRGKDKLVGTNLYPNSRESIRASLQRNAAKDPGASIPANQAIELNKTLSRFEAAAEAFQKGAAIDQIAQAPHTPAGDNVSVEAIPIRRIAGDYESLRIAAEKHEADTGSRPSLLQLNLGPSRRYSIRADWTSGFFQAGGFEVQNDRDFADGEALLQAVRTEKPAVAILTSDDETYQEQVLTLAKAIKKVHPKLHLLLAGYPGDREDVWKKAGIDGFIHARVNNFAVLKALQIQLGVQS